MLAVHLEAGAAAAEVSLAPVHARPRSTEPPCRRCCPRAPLFGDRVRRYLPPASRASIPQVPAGRTRHFWGGDMRRSTKLLATAPIKFVADGLRDEFAAVLLPPVDVSCKLTGFRTQTAKSRRNRRNRSCHRVTGIRPPAPPANGATGHRHPASGIRHPASGIRHPATGHRHPATGNRHRFPVHPC